jgi:hypothetical protein
MANRLNPRRESTQQPHQSQNLVRFPTSPPKDLGANALNLVYQAAEIFSGIEERARETEGHARAMCRSAAERVQLAERRTQAAENTLSEVVSNTDRKLCDASKAMDQAQAAIGAAEDRATAFELRAHLAEAQLRDAKEALLLVEKSIRERLLSASCANYGSRDALAV